MKGKRKVLPAILMAGSMAVPNAAMASQLAKSLTLTAADRPASRLVVDSQEAYNQDGFRRAVLPQWAEVVWEQVTWVRTGPENQ